MDALRHFSNHVYVKYMGNCRQKEPPRDWVKLESLVNHENLKIKPELFSLITYLVLLLSQLLLGYGPTSFRGLLTKSVYSECLKATSLLPLKSRK